MHIVQVDQSNCDKYPGCNLGEWLLISGGEILAKGSLDLCVSVMIELLNKRNPTLLGKMGKATIQSHEPQAGTGCSEDYDYDYELCIIDGEDKDVLALGSKEQCEEVLKELGRQLGGIRRTQNAVSRTGSYDDDNTDIGYER